MTLPVIYVQKSGVDRLERRLCKLDATHVETAQVSSQEKKDFEMYRKVETCKTCRYFKESLGIIETGYCYIARTQDGPVPRKVPIDGSGFCHNHEVIW